MHRAALVIVDINPLCTHQRRASQRRSKRMKKPCHAGLATLSSSPIKVPRRHHSPNCAFHCCSKSTETPDPPHTTTSMSPSLCTSAWRRDSCILGSVTAASAAPHEGSSRKRWCSAACEIRNQCCIGRRTCHEQARVDSHAICHHQRLNRPLLRTLKYCAAHSLILF